MTALANNRIIDYRDGSAGPKQFTKPVIASDIIFKGAMVAINTAGDCGPAAVSGMLEVLGVAMAKVDNSSGSAGDKSVRLQTGVFSFVDDGSTTEADLPALLYAVDDQTLSLDSVGTRKVAGLGISMDPKDSSKVLVLIGPMVVQQSLELGYQISTAGSATLVAGTVTVTARDVRADSIIVATPKGVSGSSDFAYIDADTRTAGVSFTLEAKTVAHALDTDAVGDVDWIIVNP